jgi:hypothetical protein
MTDIVKWLRGMGADARRLTTNSYRYDEAADEIERLRAALHKIKRCNAQYNFGSKLVRLVDGALEKLP